jgi:GalNAc-alpha-(1->4)-GalNAc-alpha-(1->3)-diNAcBac-PP-undecaprenol alpha-1,4-N-acetyl-D-galactosaminyltransferase
MKIFIITPCLNHGGAERVSVMLANGFSNLGNDVSVVTDLYVDVAFELDKKVRKLNLVNEVNPYGKIIKWLNSIYLLRKYLNKYKPDVIIGFMNVCSLVGKLASLGLNIPVVMTEHNSFERPMTAPFSIADRISKFWINKIYNCMTVLTEADEKVVSKKLNNVYVMPNPLALEPVEKIPFKENIILAAGRLDAWYCKGFDVLVKAWGLISKKYPDWTLQIAGTGSLDSMEYLNDLARKYEVEEQIEFLGFRKNIIELYKKSAIFVLSSRYEGFGLVLIEAMSQGCACVACDFGGRQHEIIRNDDEGLLCKPDGEHEMAKLIDRLIGDERLRTNIQNKSVERSKDFAIDKIVVKWDNLLKLVIKK